MGRECNSIFRKKSGLERLPLELAQSVEEIEAPEIDSPRSQAYQRFHGRLRRSEPNQRNPVVNENVEKNEILSRTLRLRRLLYLVLALFLFNQVMCVGAATLRPKSVLKSRKHAYERPNKNCKEFDVTSRAYLADLIFEGTMRSHSTITGRYEGTFSIINILKQRNSTVRLLPKSQVRIHFAEHRKKRPQHCNAQSVSRIGNVHANLTPGGVYYVFVHGTVPMNYTARGDPIVRNNRNRKSIMSVLSLKKEAKPPQVLGLHNVSEGVSSPIRLTCQVKGLPVPRITWSKDGTLLIPSPHVNITYHRRNSTIHISSARIEDSGRYTCRAVSITGAKDAVSVFVNISKHQQPDRTSRPSSEATWPSLPEPCKIAAFCLNGGKCSFYSSVGEHMCVCADGFKGERCELKDVSGGGYPSGIIDDDILLPTLKRLIRGHTRFSEAEYKAVIQSMGGKKKFRHWLSAQRTRAKDTTVYPPATEYK